MQIVKNSTIYLGSSILSKMIPFLLLPIMTKYLTPKEQGTLSIYLILITLYSAFIEKGADVIVSVCEMDHGPLWSNTLDDSLSMNGFLKDEILNKRSHGLDKYFRLNGAIYICRPDRLLKEKSFFLKDNIFAYKMNRKFSIDIDEEIDFKMAEVLLND